MKTSNGLVHARLGATKMAAAAAALMLAASPALHAQPVAADAPAGPESTVSPAASAASAASDSAAATDDVSGVLVPETESGPSPARHLLVVPRLAVATAAMPVRGGLTIYSEEHIHERLLDIFFDDSRTFGVYPTVALETSLTPGVGARLVHKNLFGQGARLRLGADYGGESRFRLEGGLTSPAFAGGLLRTRLTGGWQRQPRAAFFGIGDQDLAQQPDPSLVALPARGSTAVSTVYSQEVVHAEAAVELDPAGPLFAAVSTAYFVRNFEDTVRPTGVDDAAPVGRTDVRFDPNTLVGWDQGTKVSYTEAQLGWNSLTTANPYVSAAAPSTGTKVVAFAGLARGVSGSNVAYTRYGVDGFRYFDLYGGDRVLVLRGRMEGVAGADEQIPFTDLPRLGGPGLLRGFARDRFRDRVAVLGSMEYHYPIWRQLGGFLFVDAGRVLPTLSDAGHAVIEPRLLRVGGGGGLELLHGEAFRMRGQVAGSEEGFFFQLALEPIYRLPTHNYRI